MSFIVAKSVNFGPLKTGLLTVGYQLINYDGSVQQGRTTTGIIEISAGTGIYGGDVTFPDGWSGFILWDSGDASPYYANDNFDVRSYQNLQGTGTVANYTYNPFSAVGMIRLLTGDVGPVFALSDQEIQVLLNMTSNDFFMTASVACLRLAASQMSLAIIRKAGNFMEDKTSIATNLMKLSEKYEDIANSVPADAQAEVIYTDFNYNQLLTDRVHRGEPFDNM